MPPKKKTQAKGKPPRQSPRKQQGKFVDDLNKKLADHKRLMEASRLAKENTVIRLAKEAEAKAQEQGEKEAERVELGVGDTLVSTRTTNFSGGVSVVCILCYVISRTIDCFAIGMGLS